MTDTPHSTAPDAPHCGPFEQIVFAGKLSGTDDHLCVCLEPGLFYRFHLGPVGQPPQVSFSVDGMQVQGDYDWTQIEGADWTFLRMSHADTTYTVWVSRTKANGDLPGARLEITGAVDRTQHFEPATITHDLPFR